MNAVSACDDLSLVEHDRVLVAGAVVQQRLVEPHLAVRARDRDLDLAVPRPEMTRDHDAARVDAVQPHLRRHRLAVAERARSLDLQTQARAVLHRVAPARHVLERGADTEGVAAHDHVALEAVADVDELLRVEAEREAAPERGRPATRVRPRVVHPRERRRPVRLRRDGQGLLPRVQQVEAVAELVDAREELQALLVGRRAAQARVEHGAALPLLALLVEHDPEQVLADVVHAGVQEPHGPLRDVLPAREVIHHRRVQLGVAPGCVRPGLAGRDDVRGARRQHLDAGFRERRDDGERGVPVRPTGASRCCTR